MIYDMMNSHLLDAAVDSATTGGNILNGANIASLVITVILIIGVVVRFNRKLHPPIMLLCFAADVGLVVWLEVTRKAVETAVGNMSALMIIHIVLAVLMLVLYVALAVSGFKLLKAPEGEDSEAIAKQRSGHKAGAVAFFIVRVAVLVTALIVAANVGVGAGGPADTPTEENKPVAPTPKPAITTRDGKTIP